MNRSLILEEKYSSIYAKDVEATAPELLEIFAEMSNTDASILEALDVAIKARKNKTTIFCEDAHAIVAVGAVNKVLDYYLENNDVGFSSTLESLLEAYDPNGNPNKVAGGGMYNTPGLRGGRAPVADTTPGATQPAGGSKRGFWSKLGHGISKAAQKIGRGIGKVGGQIAGGYQAGKKAAMATGAYGTANKMGNTPGFIDVKVNKDLSKVSPIKSNIHANDLVNMGVPRETVDQLNNGQIAGINLVGTNKTYAAIEGSGNRYTISGTRNALAGQTDQQPVDTTTTTPGTTTPGTTTQASGQQTTARPAPNSGSTGNNSAAKTVNTTQPVIGVQPQLAAPVEDPAQVAPVATAQDKEGAIDIDAAPARQVPPSPYQRQIAAPAQQPQLTAPAQQPQLTAPAFQPPLQMQPDNGANSYTPAAQPQGTAPPPPLPPAPGRKRNKQGRFAAENFAQAATRLLKEFHKNTKTVPIELIKK